MIDELATEQEGKAKVGKVNIGDHFELAAKYGITGVPTILVFKGGEVVDKKLGALPKDQLEKLLSDHA